MRSRAHGRLAARLARRRVVIKEFFANGKPPVGISNMPAFTAVDER
jgi:hypothetical protein